MNTSFDTRSNRERDRTETDRQEVMPAPDAALIEVGRISDTQGAWIGIKTDVGLGVIYY